MKIYLLTTFLLLSAVAFAQTTPQQPAPKLTYIRCGALFDGRSDQLRRNVGIVVQGDRIREVGVASAPTGAQTIDLSGRTCLPGLIDTHTHTLLQGDPRDGLGP
jgi:imidazolonepropionase-like amidohydrolase